MNSGRSKADNTLAELKAAPWEPSSLRGWRLWEPENGWGDGDTMDVILEMLRRGYDFEIVACQRD